MQVNIHIDGLKEVQAMLGSQARQASYAASRALNTTAFAINAKLKTEMAGAFKGGATAYTLRAFRIEKATKATLTAAVVLRSDAPPGGLAYDKALAHLFTGGLRKFKKIEGWLRARKLLPEGLAIAPGIDMPLDSFGNMRMSVLTEMLGVLGSGQRNIRVFKRSGANKAQKATGYFVVPVGDKSHLHPGIYKRLETGHTSTLRQMVIFINPTIYRQYIDLQRTGQRVVGQTYQNEFDKELAAALATAK